MTPTAPPANQNPTKPGFATSEFWASTVAPTVFLVLSQFNIGHIDTTNPHVEAFTKLGSYLLAAIGYGFYAISRGHMKKGAVIAGALNQLVAAAPDIATNLRAVIPAPIYKDLEPMISTLQAVDPYFSVEQLQQLSAMIESIVKNHTESTIGPLIEQAILAAAKNVNSNANSPTVVADIAKDVQQVEDVIHGATAVTTPVDITPVDGASYTAP